MKSVCVIGNSHLAAYKLGWELIKEEFPGIHLDFFGAPGKVSEKLEVVGRSLVPKGATAKEQFAKFSGRSSITGNYSYFLVCDMGLGAGFALRLYSRWRAEIHFTGSREPVSNEVFQLALNGLLRSQHVSKLVKNIRRISAAPIVITPAPMRSSEHPDRLEKIAQENGDDAKLSDAFQTAVAELAAGLRVRVLLQPTTTLVSPLNTDPKFTRAASIQPSVSADPAIVDKDFAHTNELYGAVALKEFIAKIFAKPDHPDGYSRDLRSVEPWLLRSVRLVRRILEI